MPSSELGRELKRGKNQFWAAAESEEDVAVAPHHDTTTRSYNREVLKPAGGQRED